MLAFDVTLRPGLSIHEQIVYAAKKAIVGGRLKPGDAFPSVRALSKELRVNPNTAHKVVATLVGEGLLEVKPGIGTVVAKMSAATAEQRRALLKEDAERLVVEARHLALGRQDVVDAVVDHWERLNKRRPSKGPA